MWDEMENDFFYGQEEPQKSVQMVYSWNRHMAYLFEEKLVSTGNQLLFFMVLLAGFTGFFGAALYSLGGMEGTVHDRIEGKEALWEAWNLVTSTGIQFGVSHNRASRRREYPIIVVLTKQLNHQSH